MVSHGESWRGSCAARDVTDLAIGSSDWLGSGLNLFITQKTSTTRAVTRFEGIPAFTSTIHFLTGGAYHLFKDHALFSQRFSATRRTEFAQTIALHLFACGTADACQRIADNCPEYPDEKCNTADSSSGFKEYPWENHA